jgi:hypothetical protein
MLIFVELKDFREDMLANTVQTLSDLQLRCRVSAPARCRSETKLDLGSALLNLKRWLSWLLGNYTTDEAKELISQNIRGEISSRCERGSSKLK